MVALLAGTPATVLIHDSRTRELAELHGIPHRRLDQLAPTTDAAELYADVDLSTMNARHAHNFARYLAFLTRNGLPHVWEAGESPDEFDRQLAAVRLPAAVRPPRRARRFAHRLARQGWQGGQGIVRTRRA
jgi:hypothetical protein